MKLNGKSRIRVIGLIVLVLVSNATVRSQDMSLGEPGAIPLNFGSTLTGFIESPGDRAWLSGGGSGSGPGSALPSN